GRLRCGGRSKNALTHNFSPAPNALFIPWTEDPEAQMLLARCGANPPRGEWKRTVYVQTADEWFEYTGPLADRLTALRDEYGYRALMHYHDANEYGPFEAYCRSASVGEAIEAAIAAAADVRVAA
ncbi:MAG TPA: hypothetical protein VF637_13420, partial [Sphingomicrobium sp.]